MSVCESKLKMSTLPYDMIKVFKTKINQHNFIGYSKKNQA